MARRTFLGNLRLALLLCVLVFVALGAWLDRRRSTDWDAPLRVTVYPLSAVSDAEVRGYVASLDAAAFADAESFLAEQAQEYGVPLDEPMRVRVSHAAPGLPPALPADAGVLTIALWSLQMRYWAWRVAANDPLPPPDVQVFALYHAARNGQALPDSMGLSKGLMAVAQLFAGGDAEGGNQVVLVHELLHTLGATDKYDLQTNQPLQPDGYAEPHREPLYPQSFAELMAGRIPVSSSDSTMPESLRQVIVGAKTASEIGWSKR